MTLKERKSAERKKRDSDAIWLMCTGTAAIVYLVLLAIDFYGLMPPEQPFSENSGGRFFWLGMVLPTAILMVSVSRGDMKNGYSSLWPVMGLFMVVTFISSFVLAGNEHQFSLGKRIQQESDLVRQYYATKYHVPENDVEVEGVSSTRSADREDKKKCKESNALCFAVKRSDDNTTTNVLVYASPGKVESMEELKH